MPTETTSKNCPNPTDSRESLQCPRCESTNTKFCYYNNYSLSQPRHFCKSCRRYWTHGGSLRDVPVGGSSRKASTSKRRPRTTTTPPPPPPAAPSSSHSPSNSSSTSASALTQEPKPTLSVPDPVVHVPSEGWFGYGLTESNAALWGSMGFLEFMGGSGNGVDATNSNNSAWKVFSDVEVGGLVDGGVVGDAFAWPDLAISTPGGATVG